LVSSFSANSIARPLFDAAAADKRDIVSRAMCIKPVVVALAAAVLLASASAHAQTANDPPRDSTVRLHIVSAAFVTLASADLAVSMYQIGRGVGREQGFGAAWQDSPVAFAISKSAMTATFVYAVQRLHKTRPKTAIVLGVAATAMEGFLVAHGAALTPPAR
jgi:hypothetical protein